MKGVMTVDSHSINTTKMGIRGLAGYLKWKSPTSRKNIQWAQHADKRWIIDCSCLLYRARAAGLEPLSVIAGLVVRMRSAKIEPIVVFDGKPPSVKSETLEQRRAVRSVALKELSDIQTELKDTGLSSLERAEKEIRISELHAKAPQVSSRDRDELKRFLYACGVLFITASGEADDILAYLARSGFVHAVVSTDMDMLARGVPLLIVPETNDATVLTELRLDAVLSDLCLRYEQFVRACVLMGTDYMGRDWKTMEPRFAVDAVKRSEMWMDASGGYERMEKAVEILRGDNVKWEDLLSECQHEKWRVGAPLREPENLEIMCAEHGWPSSWFDTLTYK
jgi:hypothetical protein